MGPKFSNKKVTRVTKSVGARRQLRQLPLGGKSWQVMVSKAVKYPACGQVIPGSSYLPGWRRGESETNASLNPTVKVVKPAEVKECCGIPIAKKRGAKCSKCGTSWGKIESLILTYREFSQWSKKVLPPSEQKTWVTSPRGAVFPGTGKWMTQAELSESIEFMQVG